MGGRYYPENRFPDNRPDRYPDGADGRFYPTTVTGTRYPTSDNRFPVGNDRSPIFILKYGNRGGGVGAGMSGGASGKSYSYYFLTPCRLFSICVYILLLFFLQTTKGKQS